MDSCVEDKRIPRCDAPGDTWMGEWRSLGALERPRVTRCVADDVQIGEPNRTLSRPVLRGLPACDCRFGSLDELRLSSQRGRPGSAWDRSIHRSPVRVVHPMPMRSRLLTNGLTEIDERVGRLGDTIHVSPLRALAGTNAPRASRCAQTTTVTSSGPPSRRVTSTPTLSR